MLGDINGQRVQWDLIRRRLDGRSVDQWGRDGMRRVQWRDRAGSDKLSDSEG